MGFYPEEELYSFARCTNTGFFISIAAPAYYAATDLCRNPELLIVAFCHLQNSYSAHPTNPIRPTLENLWQEVFLAAPTFAVPLYTDESPHAPQHRISYAKIALIATG